MSHLQVITKPPTCLGTHKSHPATACSASYTKHACSAKWCVQTLQHKAYFHWNCFVACHFGCMVKRMGLVGYDNLLLYDPLAPVLPLAPHNLCPGVQQLPLLTAVMLSGAFPVKCKVGPKKKTPLSVTHSYQFAFINIAQEGKSLTCWHPLYHSLPFWLRDHCYDRPGGSSEASCLPSDAAASALKPSCHNPCFVCRGVFPSLNHVYLDRDRKTRPLSLSMQQAKLMSLCVLSKYMQSMPFQGSVS